MAERQMHHDDACHGFSANFGAAFQIDSNIAASPDSLLLLNVLPIAENNITGNNRSTSIPMDDLQLC